MKSDPFAPATSPLHPSNIRRAAAEGRLAGRHAARFSELVLAHVTDHEHDADRVPALEELERRQTLVDEFREQLATEGPDAEPPTLIDLTNNAYEWREGDRTEDDPEEPSGQPDGETSSAWVPILHTADRDQSEVDGDETPSGTVTVDRDVKPEVPPRNGPGSDTDTWRAFAGQATGTEPTQWATLTRTDIIATLERDGVIPSEQA